MRVSQSGSRAAVVVYAISAPALATWMTANYALGGVFTPPPSWTTGRLARSYIDGLRSPLANQFVLPGEPHYMNALQASVGTI